MSARSILVFCALAALLCSSCASEKLGGANSDFPQGDGSSLIYEGAHTLNLLPNDMEMLRVQYVDAAGEPVAGVQVEFSFLGLSGSAFLPSERPVTDGDGIVTTTLSIGSNPPPSFQVRVSALGVAPVLIDVNVVNARVVVLRVEAPYTGQRAVVSRTVSAIASKTCTEALEAKVAGDITLSFDDEKHRPEFELGPGISYAVLAWGKDSSNAKLAVGCAEFHAPITRDAAEAKPPVLKINLVDIPMSPAAQSYDFLVDLDVSVSMERLAAGIKAGALADYPVGEGKTAQGALFVASVDAELREEGLSDEADALVPQHTALAQSIESKISAESGLADYASSVADQLASVGGHLKLHAIYGIGASSDVPMSISFDVVHARNADDTYSLLLNGKGSDYTPPLATIDAAYSDPLGAVEIKTLSVNQGLGGYGKAVLNALALSDGYDVGEFFGCQAMAQVIASDADACDKACRERACVRTLAAVRASVVGHLAAFDVSHPNIGLRGVLFAHAHNDEGIVDALGPAKLTGNWGMAESSDDVTGSIPEPPPTGK